MLTENQEVIAKLEHSHALAEERTAMQSVVSDEMVKQPSQLAKFLRIEWLGQTVASLCWIVSVFCYGITSAGDWLQLGAASAWLIANIAAVTSTQAE